MYFGISVPFSGKTRKVQKENAAILGVLDRIYLFLKWITVLAFGVVKKSRHLTDKHWPAFPAFGQFGTSLYQTVSPLTVVS